MRTTVTSLTRASTTTACTTWSQPRASVRTWVSLCWTCPWLTLVSVWSGFQHPACLDFSDAQLLTIKSSKENEFVSKYIQEDPLATNRVWLGLEISDAGNFKPLLESGVDHKPRRLETYKANEMFNQPWGLSRWAAVSCHSLSRLFDSLPGGCLQELSRNATAVLVIFGIYRFRCISAVQQK